MIAINWLCRGWEITLLIDFPLTKMTILREEVSSSLNGGDSIHSCDLTPYTKLSF
jgi:hypothetical protein